MFLSDSRVTYYLIKFSITAHTGKPVPLVPQPSNSCSKIESYRLDNPTKFIRKILSTEWKAFWVVVEPRQTNGPTINNEILTS